VLLSLYSCNFVAEFLVLEQKTKVANNYMENAEQQLSDRALNTIDGHCSDGRVHSLMILDVTDCAQISPFDIDWKTT
jgi:hypothetical protein